MAQPLPEQSETTKAGCCGYIFFVFIALPFLGFFVWHAWKDLRCYTIYRPATCRILGNQLLESSGEDGATYQPQFEIEFVTEDGRTVRTRGYDTWDVYSSGHDGQQAILDSYEVGKSYPCWYDPGDPSQIVLTRRPSYMYLVALIPLLFIVIGLTMAWRYRRNAGRGTSPEAKLFRGRTVDAGGKAAAPAGLGCLFFSILLAAAGVVVFWQWPVTLWGLALGLGIVGLIGVVLSVLSLASGNRIVRIETGGSPSQPTAGRNLSAFVRGETSVETKPGEVLAVALSPEKPSQPGVGCLVFSILLMAASAAIFWQWASSLWGLALGLGVIGLIGATVTFFSLGSRKRIRSIQVETSAAELIPGQDLECFVRLTGQTELNGVIVRLVCEERATYRQGTNTRTEKRKVLEEVVAEQTLVQLSPLEPLELRGRTKVPLNAMHSFKSAHNEIAWFIQVNCDIPRWPDSEARYPLVVAPRWGSTEGADA